MDKFLLVPVDYQPDFENVSFVPVDHDPFSADGVTPQAPTQTQSETALKSQPSPIQPAQPQPQSSPQ
ncbi:MAG TPA: hypothetical protein VFW23_04740 [Tepidisphaeraceae bacterium]|nr:hypothetical protein [Tepidisphaeraceae bacterium]